MIHTRPNPRATSLLVLVAVVASGVPATLLVVPGAQAMETKATEDWGPTWSSANGFNHNWTTTGQLARADTSTTFNGTTPLQLLPRLGAFVSVSNSYGGMAFNGAPYAVSTFFENLNVGAASGSLNVTLTQNCYVGVNFTGGPSQNQVFVFAGNATAYQAFPTMFNATQGTWYNVNITIDPGTATVSAVAKDSAGRTIAQTPSGGNNILQAIATNAGNSGEHSPAQFTGITNFVFKSTYTSSSLTPPTSWGIDLAQFRVWAATPPQAPVSVAGLGGPGAGQVNLTWLPPLDNGGAPVTNYSIWGGASPGNETYLANVSSSTLSYIDGGYGNGVTRYYYVVAWNEVGNSSPSTKAALTTLQLPGAPTKITAKPGPGVGQVNLSVSPPTYLGGLGGKILQYAVYRSTDNATFSRAGNASGTTGQYVDSNRTNGTTYYYEATAVNAVGEGPLSNVTSSLPGPDRATAPSLLAVSPAQGWTTDPRTVNFTYTATVSNCDANQTCPVSNAWSIWLDGTPGQPDGTLLANGTNTHPGNAQPISYAVSAQTNPSGTNGTHLLKIGASTRVGSTQWNITTTDLSLLAPIPGILIGPTGMGINNTTKTGGVSIQVTANYTVFEQRCRANESCPVANSWQVLLDGTSPTTADGTVLAAGTYSDPGNGTFSSHFVNESVNVPYLDPGPHYLKVAARPDPNGTWQVAVSALSNVLFFPRLEDPTYVAHANGSYYVTNGTTAWVEGTPTVASPHSGTTVWGVGLGNVYPTDAQSTLRIQTIPLALAVQPTLTFWTNYELSSQATVTGLVRIDGAQTEQVIEPAAGPAYSLPDSGTEGWTGDSGGWQQVTFDLSPFVGHTVDVDLQFLSGPTENLGYFLVDDIALGTGTPASFTDTLEAHWATKGGWMLAKPTVGPAQGADGLLANAWGVAPFSGLLPDMDAQLTTPAIDLRNANGASLSFKSWLKTEYFHDKALVQISEDGGATYRTIFPTPATPYTLMGDGTYGWSGNSQGFQNVTFDLSNFNGSIVQLRFLLQTDNTLQMDETGSALGWFLSDFEIDEVHPAYPAPQFGSHTRPTDGFYAYFQTSNTAASFTSPEGRTTTIRYTGQTGDVVAHLGADGTLTARQALVGPAGPTNVSASNFVVTNGTFVGNATEGTWTIVPAPTLPSGTGGTQLTLGGKTFNDVAAENLQPIETTGGRLSISNRPSLIWNWQDQTTAWYNVSATPNASAVEQQNDTRLRYDVRTNPNGVTDVQDAAFKAGLVQTNPDLLNIDARHSTVPFTTSARMNDSLQLTDPTDGVPEWQGLVKLPGQAQSFIPSAVGGATLSVAISTLGLNPAPPQLVVIISPGWSQAMLVEYSAGLSAHRGPTDYATFLAMLDDYQNLTSGPGSDHFLTRVLRDDLDQGMTFYVDVESSALNVGNVDLSNFAGTPADGTWTIIRDATTPGVTLNVGSGSVLRDLSSSGNLTLGGVLAYQWSFLNFHLDTVSCIAPGYFVLVGPCTRLLSTQGMRAYGAPAAGKLAALLDQVAGEYEAAGKTPLPYFATLTVPSADPLPNLPAGSAGPTTNGWGPIPTQELSQVGQNLQIGTFLVANGDSSGNARRSFNWQYYEYPPDLNFSGHSTVQLGFEPSDGTTTGSTIRIDGLYLATVGVDTNKNVSIVIDPNHRAGSSIAIADGNEDGVKDILVTVSHFSQVWVAVSNNNWDNVTQVSSYDYRAAFGLGYYNQAPTVLSYLSTASPAWSNDLGATGANVYARCWTMTSIASTSEHQAWVAANGFGTLDDGQHACKNPSIEDIRTNSGGHIQLSAWYTSNLPYGTVIHQISPVGNDVWFAADTGVYHLNVSYDQSGSPRGSFSQGLVGQFYGVAVAPSSLDGIAVDANSELWRFDGSRWWDTHVRLPFPMSPILPSGTQSTFAAAVDGTGVWILPTGGSGSGGFWSYACDCFQPVNVNNHLPFNAVASGVSKNDVWTASNHAEECSRNVCSTKDPPGQYGTLVAASMSSVTDGWFAGVDSGNLYHYTLDNMPPTANFTMTTPTPYDTSMAIGVNGSASSDPNNDPLSFIWDWGDGTAQVSGIDATHQYRAPGNYPITLNVTDPSGASNYTHVSVHVSYAQLHQNTQLFQSMGGPGEATYYQFTVPPSKSVARFWLAGPAGASFQMYVKRNGVPSPTNYDLAGTLAGSSQDVRTTNPASGTYTIVVIDTAGSGAYTIRAGAFTPPSAPSIALSALGGGAVTMPILTNVITAASSASNDELRVTYHYDWGDGYLETSDALFPPAASLLGHEYSTPGDYTLKVTAIDENNLAASSSATLNIRNTPALASTYATGLSLSGATIESLAGATGGYAGFNLSVQYGPTTSYGSNSTIQSFNGAQNPCEIGGQCWIATQLAGLASSTTYHFRVWISTPAGATATPDQTFTTRSLAFFNPTITSSSTVSSPNQLVYLSGGAAVPAGDGVTYRIDWGDGSSVTVPNTGAYTSPANYNVSHTYAAIGTYAINVTATDTVLPESVTNVSAHVVAYNSILTFNTSYAASRTLSSATIETLASVGGDYAGFNVSVQYGLSTGYGSNTSLQSFTIAQNPCETSGQCWIATPLANLATGTTYHYRVWISTPTSANATPDQTFTTRSLAVFNPTIIGSPTVTAPGETVNLSGTAQIPSGDGAAYSIQWGDGTSTRYPTSGNLTSPASYTATHTYAYPGNYPVNVTADDTTLPEIVTNRTIHLVVDYPTPALSSPTDIMHLDDAVDELTLHGAIFLPSFSQKGNATFFWGAPGSSTSNFGNLQETTFSRSVSQHVTWPSGADLEYFLRACDERGCVDSSTAAIHMPEAPAIHPLNVTGSVAIAGARIDLAASYVSALNVSPANDAAPYVKDENGFTYRLEPNSAATTYAQGVTYTAPITMFGTHFFTYFADDGLYDPANLDFCHVMRRCQAPVTIAQPGLPLSAFTDPIEFATSGAISLPSEGWSTTTPTSSQSSSHKVIPSWHVVQTPTMWPLSDAPDNTTTHASVSLWFGNDTSGDYSNNGSRAFGTVTTPPIRVSTSGVTSVRFWTYWDTRSVLGEDDIKNVIVHPLDGGRDTLLMNLTTVATGYHSWRPVSASLQPWAGRPIQLKFTFDSIDRPSPGFKGWYITDLVVGVDRANSGVPDVAKAEDNFTQTFTNGAHGLATSGTPITVFFPHIQYSNAASATALVYFNATGVAGLNISINNSKWNTVLLLNGTPLVGGAVSLSQSFSPPPGFIGPPLTSYVLKADLARVGFSLRDLATTDEFEIDINASRALVLTTAAINVSGYLRINDPNNAKDGILDSDHAFMGFGTPLGLYAGGDGLRNRVTPRPGIHTEPPMLYDVRPLGSDGSWTGLTFSPQIAAGIGLTVTALVNDTSGHQLPADVTPVNATYDRIQFPCGNVQSVSIRTDDSTGVTSWNNVTFTNPGGTPCRTHPSMWTVAMAAPQLQMPRQQAPQVQPETPLNPVVDVPLSEPFTVGYAVYRVGMELWEDARAIYQSASGAGQSPPPLTIEKKQSLSPPVLTITVQDVANCLNGLTLELPGGWSGTMPSGHPFSQYGAKGIEIEYPGSYPNGDSDLKAAIRNANDNGPARFFRLDPYSGDFLYIDALLQVVHQWRVTIDPAACVGYIEREDRTDFLVSQDVTTETLDMQGERSPIVLATLNREKDDPPKIPSAPLLFVAANESATHGGPTSHLMAPIDAAVEGCAKALPDVSLPDIPTPVISAPDSLTAGCDNAAFRLFWDVHVLTPSLDPTWYWQPRPRSHMPASWNADPRIVSIFNESTSPFIFEDMGHSGTSGGSLASGVSTLFQVLSASRSGLCARLALPHVPLDAYVPAAYDASDYVVGQARQPIMLIDIFVQPSVIAGGCG